MRHGQPPAASQTRQISALDQEEVGVGTADPPLPFPELPLPDVLPPLVEIAFSELALPELAALELPLPELPLSELPLPELPLLELLVTGTLPLPELLPPSPGLPLPELPLPALLLLATGEFPLPALPFPFASCELRPPELFPVDPAPAAVVADPVRLLDVRIGLDVGLDDGNAVGETRFVAASPEVADVGLSDVRLAVVTWAG